MTPRDRTLVEEWSSELGLTFDDDDWLILDRMILLLGSVTPGELLVAMMIMIKFQYDNFRVSYRGLEVRFAIDHLEGLELDLLARLQWSVPWR